MTQDLVFWCLIAGFGISTIGIGCYLLWFKRAQETKIQEQEQKFTDTLNERLSDNFRNTVQHLEGVQKSLGQILESQRGIHDLNKSMENLNNIMANKQARGRFGETQLQDIIKDALPKQFYEFQVSLENTQRGSTTRVDCLLRLPDPAGQLAVDSKFPLESFLSFQEAEDENQRSGAKKTLMADVKKHLKDISEKYIIEGVTADCALMFIPSEAVYSLLHSEIPELIQESQRYRVYIVSPSTMMATIVTVRSIFRDVEIRKHAEELRKYLRLVGEDVGRFNQRLENLARHFEQTQKDIRELSTSGGKIVRNIEKINTMDDRLLK